MTEGSTAASFRNNLQRTGSSDERPEREEEFWESVPVFPDREQELSCIATKLTDRKKAFFNDASERERVLKIAASDEIESSLKNRKQAFLDDVTQREQTSKTSASDEIDNSLSNRKKAFFEDASQREHVVRTSASDEIDNSLSNRKESFLADAKQRDGSINRNTSINDEIDNSLENRKKAFMQDFDQRQNACRVTSVNEEISDSLNDRKKAFFKDSNERSTFTRSETSEGIDRSEIAFRRKSFRDKDKDSIKTMSSNPRDQIQNTQHKARRIKNSNQLFKVLEKRRAKLDVEEEIKDQFPEEKENETHEKGDEDTKKVLEESKSDIGWKV